MSVETAFSGVDTIKGRDVSSVSGRAALLRELFESAHKSGGDHEDALSEFRDTLIRYARGVASADELRKAASPLEGLIAASPIVAHSTPEMRPLVAPVKPQEVAEVPSVIEKVETKVEAPKAEPSVETVTPAHVESDPQTPTHPTVRRKLGPDIKSTESVAAPSNNEAPPVSADLKTMPIAETAPANATPASEAPPEAPKELREQVELINDTLTSLGHGKAFQWLTDPETGYREYMTELLILRDLLAKGVKEEERGIFEEKMHALSARAEAVAQKVAPGATFKMEPAPEPAKISDEPISTPPPPVVRPRAPEVPATVVPPMPVQDAVRVRPPSRSSVDATPFATPPATPIKDAMIADVTTQADDPIAEAKFEAKLGAPAEDDPLYSKEVDKYLNDLLIDWLGSTGFLGFGDSGVKHPEWLAMRGVALDEALEDDGTVPPGLKQETLENLRENIRGWKEQYGLVTEQMETVEHFMRRVIRATAR